MKKFLFILRSYNDIDHITPLIDFIAEKKSHECEARVFLAPFDHKLVNENNNLKYLRGRFQTNFEFFAPTILVKYFFLMDSFINKLISLLNTPDLSGNSLSRFVSVVTSVISRIYSAKKSLVLGRYIQLVLRDMKPTIICTDWVSVNSFPYSEVMVFAKSNSVPVVGLPHGLNVFNQQMDTAKAHQKTLKEWQTNFFDWQVVPNDLQAMHINDTGYPRDRIVCLGSLRFEKCWIEKKRNFEIEFFDDSSLKHSSQSPINIVIFLNKLHYRGNQQAVAKIIEASAQFGNVVVKPHTRKMSSKVFRRHTMNGSTVIVGNDVSSNALISWCDIAVFWGSSIGIQVLHDKKPFIYPCFVHGYPTIYEPEFPQCCVEGIGEFKTLIGKLMSAGLKVNYSEKQRLNFFNKYVYASGGFRDLAPEYYETIIEMSDNMYEKH